jgi:hypothetical protein
MYSEDHVEDSQTVIDKDFFIEAVVCCVNHGDFLAHTLPLNKNHFDKLVIVTAPEDAVTRQVCKYYGVETVLTDKFRSRWGEFCKGAGINEGLRKLSKRSWILHMDADIVVPPHFRETLTEANLDTQCIYGVDRFCFPDYRSFQKFYGRPELHTEGPFVNVVHGGVPLGTRVSFKTQGGYLPIGFFQLFHADSGNLVYPEGHQDSSREDLQFPAKWPRSKRGFIPEILVYHVESEPNQQMGINWRKRTTKPFHVDSL